MKRFKKITAISTIVILTSMVFLTSCSSDDNDTDQITINTELTLADKDALLFMLEEEKLARDTYEFLDNLWSISQFANIKNSEQSHMNAVIDLLTINNISFTILPEGEFANEEIQNLYNQFITNGSINQVEALKVGATIEDLDIKDLQTFIDATSNTSLIAVFESLQCGSRNHLRSFVLAIENNGAIYIPQFLTLEEFNNIINSSNEQCN